MQVVLFFLFTISLFSIEIEQKGENSRDIYIAKQKSSTSYERFGILQHAPNNGYFYFSINNNLSVCKPYGVVTLHEIFSDQNSTQRCRKAIESYFKHNPKDYYFAAYHIHLQQMYHLTFKDNECVIYSHGNISYARELLQAGLAKVRKGFGDILLRNRYKKEEEGAKFLKKGMFHSNIPLNCRMEFRR